MGRRRKKIIENVTITGIADKGMSVGRTDEGQVIFVKGAVPGDNVDVLVLRKKKSFLHGIVSNVNALSDERVSPLCEHFSICGGCKWQNLKYNSQLKYKQQTVVAAMTRIAGLEESIILPIIGCDQHVYYRNKMEYSFSDKKWLTEEEVRSGEKIASVPAVGLPPPGAFDKVVDIIKCHLQDDMTNKLRNFIREYAFANGLTFYNPRSHHGFLRNMVFRNNLAGEWMVTIIFADDIEEERIALLEAIKVGFPAIQSLNYIINTKHNDSFYDQVVINYDGADHIIESIGDIKYKIGPKSFFQTNTLQAKLLYDVAKDFASLQGGENVYDLYTGIGSIALYIANSVNHVVGIEEIDAAIADARVNNDINGIENTTFYTGDVKDLLDDSFVDTHGKADIIFTDPPRAGMHKEVVNALLQIAAPKIVYISCNPSTQARDLDLLQEKYNVVKIQAVDMFPHTHHIESVALLELK